MKVEATPLSGVFRIEPRVFGDSRGFFLETFQKSRFAAAGLPGTFVQDNHSRSTRGVLRGLHYQIRHPQGKLVMVTRGEIFDVAVDLRDGSPEFGKWHGELLSDDNHRQLFVPPGFGHGFQVLSEVADVVYKCTDFYHPEDEGGVIWNDPDLGIQWPLGEPRLSEKDRAYPTLADARREGRLPRPEPGS